MSQLNNLSSSQVSAISTKLRDNKRRARGDITASTYMRNGIEMEDTGMEYLIVFQGGQYDVVGERDIHIDANDMTIGIVYDKSKPYDVQIMAKGKLTLLTAALALKSDK